MRHEMRNKSEKLDVLIKSISKKINQLYRSNFRQYWNENVPMKSKKLHHCPAFAKNIVDKIGAGDTMLALFFIVCIQEIKF